MTEKSQLSIMGIRGDVLRKTMTRVVYQLADFSWNARFNYFFGCSNIMVFPGTYCITGIGSVT